MTAYDNKAVDRLVGLFRIARLHLFKGFQKQKGKIY